MKDDREFNIRLRTKRTNENEAEGRREAGRVAPLKKRRRTRRYAFAVSLGVAALFVSEIGVARLVETLSPDNLTTLFTMDVPSALEGSEALAADQLNLGDCFRDEAGSARKNWPAVYAAICGDLVSATNADFESRQKAKPPAPKAKPVSSLPAASAKIAPAVVPLGPPQRKVAEPRETRASAPATPPRCIVDEQGRSILRHAQRRETLPPHIVAQDVIGKAVGVALQVPEDCDLRSPVDAKILFAGEFKGYRGVIILELPQKRRLIVAGLGRISVARGDRIKRGDIVGATSVARAPALATAFGTDEGPLLFFDVRNSRGGVEPVAWLASGLS